MHMQYSIENFLLQVNGKIGFGGKIDLWNWFEYFFLPFVSDSGVLIMSFVWFVCTISNVRIVFVFMGESR